MRLVWLVVMVLLAWPARAWSDDAADREEARREFTAGQAADRQRDYQTAIEHYMRANDLVPHPNAMFNIATDYERLGKLREAARWYQRYIDAAPESPDRDRVVRLLAELQNRAGTLTVRSIPSGASVVVDGKPAGNTPYSGHIKGGAHKVVVELDGRREERSVKIEFGEPAILDVTLRGDGRPLRGATSGTLRVEGDPPGALVMVDQMPAGSLPLSLPLAPGVHRVRVTSYGYAPYDETVTIVPDRETVVDARLPRALGTFGETKPPKLRAGYLFGATSSIDTRGDAAGMVELGVRVSTLDLSVRVGKGGGLFLVDLFGRWTFGDGKVAPFVSGGYVVANDQETGGLGKGGGYLVTGGLRWDLARGDTGGFTLLVESGIRYYYGFDNSGSVADSEDKAGLTVPVMASLQVMYR